MAIMLLYEKSQMSHHSFFFLVKEVIYIKGVTSGPSELCPSKPDMMYFFILPPASAVEVIESVPSVRPSVSLHSMPIYKHTKQKVVGKMSKTIVLGCRVKNRPRCTKIGGSPLQSISSI